MVLHMVSAPCVEMAGQAELEEVQIRFKIENDEGC